MLKKMTGYFFVIIGFLGFGFFENYKGSVIPLPAVWFYSSIAVGLFGIYLIDSAKSTKAFKQKKYKKELLDRLKQNGERILLTVENCEVRGNNYYEEVLNGSSSQVNQIDALYDPNRNYKQKYIEQSAIVYYYVYGDKKIRMTSESFPCNAETLKGYVKSRMISIYINRADKSDYAFDMI